MMPTLPTSYRALNGWSSAPQTDWGWLFEISPDCSSVSSMQEVRKRINFLFSTTDSWRLANTSALLQGTCVTDRSQRGKKTGQRQTAGRGQTDRSQVRQHIAHLFYLSLAIGQYSGNVFEFCIATDIWLDEQINQRATRKHELERSRYEKMMITINIGENHQGSR